MSYSILIVDDSATTRAMIKRIIRMTDLPVAELHEAPHGKAALELLLGGTRANLILADLNMPEMDGFEMIRRIRADEKLRDIPVIVVSASPSAEDFARLERINGLLSKPFTPESIKQAVMEALTEAQHA
jgi:two-component system, chemotaxis family, chemotaxis protein CheY